MRNVTCLLMIGGLASSVLAQAQPKGQATDPAAEQEAEKPRLRMTRPDMPERAFRRLSTGQLLNLRFPQVSLDAAPFEQVIDWLAEQTGVNILVRWNELEAVGVERDRPISVKARNLRLSQLLWLVMNEAGGHGGTLAYRATGNMIVLSTEEDLNRDMVVKVYDVHDLVHKVPYNANARFVREQTYVAGLQPRVAQGAVGFQPIIGEALSGVEMYTNDDDGERFRREREGGPEEAMQELIDAIVASVEPDSWGVNGGPGTIRAFRGYLIVRNTPMVHQQLGGPLDEDEAP